MHSTNHRRPFALVAAASAALFGFASLSHAQTVRYVIALDGPSESPPVNSLGTGTGWVLVNDATATMRVHVQWSALTGTSTISHIHGPTTTAFAGTAGVMTPTPSFPSFPSGVTSGSYDRDFDLSLTSSYNSSFVTSSGGTAAAAKTALLASFAAGKAYWNIHTSFAGGGEIRGFLRPGCLSDFNGDEFSDAVDYDAFVTAWLASSPSSDINLDGFSDAIDYDDFIASWLAAC